MKSIVDVKKPVSRPEKVLQFGEGNFLRAFVDWQIDVANEKTKFNGNVVIVQPLQRGLSDMINEQKGLYTTVLRGIQNGKKVDERRVITSVSKCIKAYDQYDDYIAYAKSPDLRFVVSNTTEAGISYAPGCKLDDKPPASFPAKACQFLYRRFKAFNGSASSGLVFIPCELIEKNGDNLKRIILDYAKEWNLEADFTKWVNDACTFCNSLVDRIVPGYPKEEAEKICSEQGYKDNLLDSAEIFHLWVIESQGDLDKLAKEFPLKDAGLNVIWTKDMSFYRTRKVRILNGTHTMFVPPAYLYGLETVRESIIDKNMIKFIKKGLFDEIIPSMDGDKEALKDYANNVLERFENPFIKHELSSILLNTTAKFPVRDLPSVTGFIKKEGKVPQVLAFDLASIIALYEGKVTADREMTTVHKRGGVAVKLQDDTDSLKFFEDLYAKTKDPKELAKAVLKHEKFWKEDLTKYEGLEETVAGYLAAIQKDGIKSALDSVANR
ncbi:tagaturonate reductase [Treponema parvum]|uniref:tagaturonate reductase n=1 Tax=Treponema parvum TaxID=138851 RepID=UPI001AEBC448|nr:tagaturonate reductase [Treponema parvum]QTQ17046.1 tagaturonate reductase [Treponema parvum]